MAKLQKFKKDGIKTNVKYVVISGVVILITIVSFFLYKSYAYYKQVDSNDVIKAKVGDFRQAKYTSYDNTNTGLNCTGNSANIQCAIEELSVKLGIDDPIIRKYYAFGLPTTASTTNYNDVIASSGSKTFVQLEGNELSSCIYRNNTLECFKNNNYEAEVEHLKQVFGEDNCIVSSSDIICNDGDVLRCIAYSNGDVNCADMSVNRGCKVYSSGYVGCV